MEYEKFEWAAKLFNKIDEYEKYLKVIEDDSLTRDVREFGVMATALLNNKDVNDIVIGHLKFKIKLWKEEFESL